MMKQLPIASLTFTLLLAAPTSAQISSDSTLSTNVTTQDGLNFLIEKGNRAGGNLFHSFQEFAIPTGGEAYFNHAADIVNIFSRVTGGNISNIDGILRANGTANLFLINPAGIIFGENAALNIGGSFFATTAESVVFSDGLEFSATNPDATPLLSVNIPVGLQMGSNSGAIEVQGTGHNLRSGHPILSPINRGEVNSGLQVSPGQTFVLVGGNVNFEGGVIIANSGRIELGSVDSGFVQLAPVAQGWELGYENVQSLGDISLSKYSLVDASGFLGGGSIQIQGSNLSLSDGSVVLVQNVGETASGAIRVNASESIQIAGLLPEINIASGLVNESLGSGDSGDIEISTQQLTLKDGGVIANRTFSEARSGNIVANASESIEIIGFFFPDPTIRTVFFTGTFGTGDVGEILVSTERLKIANGGLISTSTFGTGDSGDITIKATESVEILGATPITNQVTVVGASAFNGGDGGKIEINTQQLQLLDGATVSSASFASGAAGSIILNASELVEVSGRIPGTEIPTQVISSADVAEASLQQAFQFPLVPDGRAGDLTINTSQLRVTDGANISVANVGSNDAGNLQINANSVVLDRGATINASTASGEGGNINLQIQDSVIASNNSQISADVSGNGNGGSINLVTNNLQSQSGSTISTNTTDVGDAGNINLEADTLAFDNSSILSEASAGSSGDAGSISLTTESLSLTNNATISTDSTGSGQAGNITVTAPTIAANQGSITATSLQTGGGNIQIQTEDLLLSENSLISTSVLDSSGGGGNIAIDSEFIFVRENSNIQANAVFGAGGNISINTQTIFVTPDSSITASSQIGVDGNVEISNPDLEAIGELLELPNQVSDPSEQIATGCNNSNQSQFIATGRGGIPTTPSERLSSDRTWQDLRDVSAFLSEEQITQKPIQETSPVIEAAGWIINSQGKVELVAKTGNHTNTIMAASCSGNNHL